MKQTLPFCTLAISLIWSSASAQVSYIADIKGTGWDIINDMVIDPNGNTIIVGTIEGTCDFDPSPGVFNLTSNGLRDGFIAKYDPNGTLLWAGSIGGPETDLVNAVAVDANGNIATYGWIEGTADLDPTAGVQSTTSVGFRDGCVVKVDPNGNLLWAFALTNTTQCYSGDIDFSPLNGDVIITGYYETSIDLDPNGTFILNVDMDGIVEENTMFMARYSSAGALLWGNKLAGDEFALVDVFANGGTEVINWAVSGKDAETSPSDLDPGSGTVQPVMGFGVADYMAVVQFDATGNYLWSHISRVPTGGAGTSPPDADLWDLTTDVNGNIYLAGSIHQDYSAFPGNQTTISHIGLGRDGFVLQFSSTGALLWEKVVGGPQITNDEAVVDVTLDDNGNTWLVAVLSTDAELNMGGSSANVGTLQLGDIVVVQYDPTGNYLWHGVVGGDWHDSGSRIDFWSGEAVLCGSYGTFGGTADMDITSAVQSFTAIDVYDAFITRFTPSISTGISNSDLDPRPIAHPSPCTDELFVDFTGPYQVHDAKGRILLRGILSANASAIACARLSSGLYLLVLGEGAHQRAVRFMKE